MTADPRTSMATSSQTWGSAALEGLGSLLGEGSSQSMGSKAAMLPVPVRGRADMRPERGKHEGEVPSEMMLSHA